MINGKSLKNKKIKYVDEVFWFVSNSSYHVLFIVNLMKYQFLLISFTSEFLLIFYTFPKIYLNMPFSIFEFDVFKNTMTNREKSHTLNLLAITVVWEKKVYFGIARAHYQSKKITINFTCLFLAIDLIFIRSASHSSCTRDSSLVSSSSCCCLSLEVKG